MAGTPIDELLNSLYEMIEDAWSMPLGNDKCVIERAKVLDILDEVRANLPSDLKMAREIVEKRNEVITSAKKEHDVIKQQAEEYARQRVNDHDITVEARKKAGDIIASAEHRAKEIMTVANAYCDDAMKRTEDAVSHTLGELRDARVQFKSAVKDQPGV